jgi:hypothetical protein
MPNPQIPTTYLSLTSLGSQRGYYPVRKIYRLGSLILFILFLAGSAFFVVSGIYETILATRLHGPAMIDDKLADPLVFASILLMAGSLAGWNTYNLWNKGVMVFETGFTWRDRKGIQVWRWEELVSITSAITRHYTIGIYTGTTRVYTLYLRRHQCLRLSDCFSRVEQLAQELDRNTFPLLYGSSAECYNAGQTVTFGPLAINTEGMVIGKTAYPWTQVKEVSIHHGFLKIFGKEAGGFGGANVPVATIPNVRVLLAIIHQIVGLKVG